MDQNAMPPAAAAAAEDRRALFLRLSAFYAAFFVLYGIFLPFWPVWLDHRGLDAVEIAAIMAALYWVRVGAHPLVAHIADRRGEGRRLSVVLAIAAFAVILTLTQAHGFWLLALLSALFTALYNPILPVMENIALRTIRQANLDYGRIRLWGSLTFILGAMGTGAWLTGRTPEWIVWIAAASVLLAVGACVLVPEAPRPTAAPKRGMLILLGRADFLVFIATTGLLQTSHAVFYAFGTLAWKQAGISESTIGLLWGAGVVAEILLFAFAGTWAQRLGPVRLLALSALGGILRWPLTPLTDDPALLLPLQGLHALTFAAGHMAAMAYLSRAVPEGLGATGQSLYYALTGGVLMGAVMPIAGMLYARYGADAYHAMGLQCAVALAGVWLLGRLSRGAEWRT